MPEAKILDVEVSRIREMYVRDTPPVTIKSAGMEKDREITVVYDPHCDDCVGEGISLDYVEVKLEDGSTFRTEYYSVSSVVYD